MKKENESPESKADTQQVEASAVERLVMHLRYSCIGAAKGHPQTVMKELGITYQHATPQSMGDQWWFWNCEGIPEKLPEYLTELELDPMEQIGWGLSKENAEMIRDYSA